MTALRERPRRPSNDGVDSAYRRHSRRVRAFLMRRTGDRERAEDLTQEVFLHAAEALDDPQADGPTLQWLYTVARRRFIDELRQNGRRPVEPLDDSIAVMAAPAYGPDVARAIAAAIASLPQAQRRVITLRLLQGRSFAEIAGRLGSTEVAVKMQLSRGLRAMREELRQAGVEP
jgi:RNA polymerase sigma-70 factor (ECF subfamily)